MITVVVPGKENEACAKALCRILEKFGGAFFLSEDSALEYAAVTPAFLVFNTASVRAVSSEASILLVGARMHPAQVSKQCRFDRIIADNPGAVHENEQLLSVGMSQNNTISIASVEQNTLHISVQAIVRALDGSEILPCEFSVQMTQAYGVRTALYAFCILLLSGKADAANLKIKL